MGVGWKVLNLLQQRAVARGMSRRTANGAVDLCVDGTSLQKPHEYATAVWHQRSNGPAESVNARIQTLKRKANGYRNREAFKTAIMFHLGKLDLHPVFP